jgi:hypothetical protein
MLTHRFQQRLVIEVVEEAFDVQIELAPEF